MKKMLSLGLALVMVLTMLSSVALAVQNPFSSKVIYCSPGTEVGLCTKDTNDPKTDAQKGHLYVRHYLYGDWGGVYTNYFRASKTRLGAAQSAMVGGNWMAPDTANWVKSTTIKKGEVWYAYGRANTDYGLTYIEITGYSENQA